MNGPEFLKLEKSKLLDHSFFSDKFITTISSQDLFPRVRAKIFARLYYPHILRTRLYQANTLGITPDENIQYALATILYDEYGLGEIERSHMEQYRKFMRALEFSQEELDEQIIIPELKMYISTMMQLTQSENWITAVAAVGVASEHTIPKYYRLLLEGLKKIPDINDDALELFIGHIKLDVEHSKLIENALLPHLNNKDNQEKFSKGLEINMDAREVFHTGLYREVFSQ